MSPDYYLGLCAIAKDETPFLREWVAWHHYLGFEKIYIYDNESSVPVRDVVEEFYDQGVCDTYVMEGQAMQLIAYNHCLRYHGHEFEWLAFFDLDEFICLKQDVDARVLLRDYEAYSGLALNWDMFGSAGHLARPRGLVMENFQESLGYSVQSKCIVRPSRVDMPFTSHHFLFKDGRAVNPDGLPSFGAYSAIAVDKVCLNHYSWRSQQDYEDKLRRGDATYGEFNPRSLESFYRKGSRPGEPRTDILPMARELKRRLEDGLPGMRQPLAYAEASLLPLPKVLAHIALFLRTRRPELAETLFALSYGRFQDNVEFLRLGIQVARQQERHDRALALARECLALVQDVEGYHELFQCLAFAGQREEARRIGVFLLGAAYFEQAAQVRDRVLETAGRHRIVLDDAKDDARPEEGVQGLTPDKNIEP